jgi:hypothetical protein
VCMLGVVVLLLYVFSASGWADVRINPLHFLAFLWLLFFFGLVEATFILRDNV